MAEQKLRKLLFSSFKLHGFTLRSDSCSYLMQYFQTISENEYKAVIEKLVDYMQNQRLKSPVIELNITQLAVKDCSSDNSDLTEDIFTVINVFNAPRFHFNIDLKKYVKTENYHGHVFDTANSKATLFRNRFTILKQITDRHPLFKPSVSGATDDEEKFKIYPIEYLLSSAKKLTKIITLGLLCQLKLGTYHLEDPTGIVEIDLSETNYHVGFFGDNCIVLAEGWYEDKIFHANAIGFPPAETATVSRSYLGNLNMFGGSEKSNSKTSTLFKKILDENKNRAIIFVSDVFLDQEKVIKKLQVLFQTYSDGPPIAFVFMGNFLSTKEGNGRIGHLKSLFKSFGELIASFPSLIKYSHFIFVPGPNDPACPEVLPRPPLPSYIYQDLLDKVPDAIFTSNPCRIRYCTREIVILREDVMSKMCRNTLHYPTTGNIHDHFAKTLVCQSNLVPLPLSVRPVYWGFDHGLYLYPLPDLVVIGDSQRNSFISEHSECQVTNPGSFGKSKYVFCTYYPEGKAVDESQIPDED